jgi:hypothetical protein
MGTILPFTTILGAELDQFNASSHLPSVADSISQLSPSRPTTMHGAPQPRTGYCLPKDKARKNGGKLPLPKPRGKGVQFPPVSDDRDSFHLRMRVTPK